MAISDEFLNELRSRADIETTVSSYVNLKRKGRILTGLCPFHNEKTPSFTVYPETQSYYCFGCGSGGDVITFIKNIENLDYIESVKFLADKYNLDMPEDGYDNGLSKKRTMMYEANREAARFFYKMLYSKDGRHALQYYYSRGLSDATIKKFGLGYAPDSWNMLLHYLNGKGFTEQFLYEANLLRLSIKNERKIYYDAFKNRVMFPIIDLRGNVIAFSGRVLDDSKPKYVNTGDTLIYKKGSNIFAMNIAKKTKSSSIILCEGNMDVIALHQAGFDNAVAGLGTALTEEQAHIISHYAGEVIICYDSDEAGQKATKKAIDILGKTTLKIRVIRMEGGKDPDEIIKKYGPERFRILMDGAANDIEYKLLKEREKHDVSLPSGKSDFLKGASLVLSSINSPIELDIYAARLADEFSVSKDAVLAQVAREKKNSYFKRRQERARAVNESIVNPAEKINKINPQRIKFLRAAKAEEIIIATLMNNPDLYKNLQSELNPDIFITDFNKRVFETILGRIKDGKPVGLSYISDNFTEDEVSVIAKIQTLAVDISNTAEECFDCMKVLVSEKGKCIDAKPQDMSDSDFISLFRK